MITYPGRQMRHRYVLSLASLLLCGFAISPAWSQEGGKIMLDAEAFKKWGQSEMIVLAELVRVTPGPVGLSEPPLYTHKLDFIVLETLRGGYPKGTALSAAHSIRQKDPPMFPLGKCLVGLSANKAALRVDAFEPAGDKAIEQARLASSVPLGWTFQEKDLVSPWAKLGKKAWAGGGDKGLVCAKTGRPALLAGSSAALLVEKVPPKVELKFQNPDGDGEYKITVKNVADMEIRVPALLTDGKEVLWDDCLLIVCQNKVYPMPDAKGVPEGAKALVLKPGEGVSTVVQALKLEGPEWPRGGSRVEFRFCLGEKAVTESFYYYSKHHDAVRDKLKKK